MALAADRQVVEQVGKINALPQGANTIYQGALVKVNAAGYSAPCAGEAGSQFAGIAYENSVCASVGVKSPRVITQGEFELPVTDNITQANVGDTVWATDDEKVTITVGTGSKQVVGVIVKFISTNVALVRLTPFAGVGAS